METMNSLIFILMNIKISCNEVPKSVLYIIAKRIYFKSFNNNTPFILIYDINKTGKVIR